MPAGAIYVGRPTKFGNPFPWRGDWIVWAAVARGFRADRAGRVAASIAFFREWLLAEQAEGPHAHDESGGILEYESGVEMSVAEAARGIAGFMAMVNSASIRVPKPPTLAAIRAELAGHDLACWCPIGQPCHADVLLELANPR